MSPSDYQSRSRLRLDRRRVLVSLLGGGVVGAGGLQESRATTDPRSVTVGGSLPLSGPLAAIGVPLHRGLRLWVERVNERGGLLDRDVTLDVIDDEGDPDEARDAYRSLVDDAQLLVSPYGSPATEAVIDIVENSQMPCIAHTAGERRLWEEGREWIVQMLNPVDTFLHTALDVAFRAGARSISFIHRDDVFTPTTMEGAIQKARQEEWTVCDVIEYTSKTELNQGMREITDQPPDFVLGGGFQPGEPGGGFLPDAVALARAYQEAAGSAKLVCWSIGASFVEYAETLGEQAALVTGVTGWKPYIEYPDNDRFIRRYTDRWDASPDSHAAQGYATGQLFEAGIETADSLDRTSVRDALFDMETETAFGRYRVDERGMQIGKANAVVQWQRRTPVVVWPERWQSGSLIYPV